MQFREKARVEFITNNGKKWVEKLSLWQSWLWVGWERETWAWWPPSAAMLKPRWRPPKHSLLYINVTCQSQVWLLWGTPTHLTFLEGPLVSTVSMQAPSLEVLHLPYSCWTGYAYAGYSLTLTWRWSCHGRREKRGWMFIPSSGRLSCTAQRSSTASLTGYHCQSPYHPPFPLQRGFWGGRRIGHSPSPLTVARYQPGQSPAWMWVSPGSTGLARKYNDQQIRLYRKHERWWEQMAEEADVIVQEVCSQVSSTNSMKLLPWCISSAVPLHYMNKALATAAQQEEDVPATITVPKSEGSQALHPSDSPNCQTGTPPLPLLPFLDIHFVCTPPVGHPFAGFSASPTQKKWDHSSIGNLRDQHNEQTHVDSQEVEVRSNCNSSQGNEDTPKLVPEEPTGPPSSPTKANADPDDNTVVGTLRSTRDQDSESDGNHSGAPSYLDASRENMANSNTESASRDCITCLDTDEITTRTTHKKYRKRVQASCSLGKDCLWSEAHLKQIGNSHQAVWGHDHEIIRTEWDCALEKDCNSFEMWKMMVSTSQLLHIAEANNLKIYPVELEATAHGWMKTLVLSLKQYHALYYRLYEKGMTRAMVGLQGLHSSNAFRCSNVSSSVGLKSFCPGVSSWGATLRQ